jgi:thiamine-monophosphate kinase
MFPILAEPLVKFDRLQAIYDMNLGKTPPFGRRLGREQSYVIKLQINNHEGEKMTQRCTELGERALIRRIADLLGVEEKDDCAILDQGERWLVWTTDMLHRETDFPQVATPWQMGWMTAAVNLSDLAAMGAQPLGLLVAAGFPPQTEVKFVDQLFSGLRACAQAHETEVLGGDLDSHQELTLVGSALGWVEKELILRREGARPGDLLCTTGSLGSAGAGLKMALAESEKSEMEPEREHPLVRKLLEPEPRLQEGRALARSRGVTSMMDNSDGLALSLYDLAEASQVGFLVREELIPIDPLVVEVAGSEKEALGLALHAGGDFELVFTVRPDRLEAAREACNFTVIGSVVESGVWIKSEGVRRPLEARGYEHLGKSNR